MKRAIRDAWADALESGRYAQGFEALRQDTDGRQLNCCLGVLLDVVGVRPNYCNIVGHYMWGGYGGTLPPTVRENIGISAEQADFFAEMNDDKHLPFPVIARHVRALSVED